MCVHGHGARPDRSDDHLPVEHDGDDGCGRVRRCGIVFVPVLRRQLPGLHFDAELWSCKRPGVFVGDYPGRLYGDGCSEQQNDLLFHGDGRRPRASVHQQLPDSGICRYVKQWRWRLQRSCSEHAGRPGCFGQLRRADQDTIADGGHSLWLCTRSDADGDLYGDGCSGQHLFVRIEGDAERQRKPDDQLWRHCHLVLRKPTGMWSRGIGRRQHQPDVHGQLPGLEADAQLRFCPERSHP